MSQCPQELCCSALIEKFTHIINLPSLTIIHTMTSTSASISREAMFPVSHQIDALQYFPCQPDEEPSSSSNGDLDSEKSCVESAPKNASSHLNIFGDMSLTSVPTSTRALVHDIMIDQEYLHTSLADCEACIDEKPRVIEISDPRSDDSAGDIERLYSKSQPLGTLSDTHLQSQNDPHSEITRCGEKHQGEGSAFDLDWSIALPSENLIRANVREDRIQHYDYLSKVPSLLSLNMSGAFDRVPPTQILDCLRRSNVDGETCRFIESFLYSSMTNRRSEQGTSPGPIDVTDWFENTGVPHLSEQLWYFLAEYPYGVQILPYVDDIYVIGSKTNTKHGQQCLALGVQASAA